MNKKNKLSVNSLLYSVGGMIGALASIVTALNVNTTCLFYAHQPKLPSAARKLSKF